MCGGPATSACSRCWTKAPWRPACAASRRWSARRPKPGSPNKANSCARAAQTVKAAPAELPARIDALLEDRRRLEREISDLRRQMATGGGSAVTNKTVAGITFAGRTLDGVPAKDLKGMADDDQEAARLGSRRPDQRRRGQGFAGGGGDRRSYDAVLRRRLGSRRLGGAGRQGRWRQTGYGPGRRSRQRPDRGCLGRHRKRTGQGRGLTRHKNFLCTAQKMLPTPVQNGYVVLYCSAAIAL